MNTASHLRECASELVEAARSFRAAAQAPTSHAGAPDALAGLEEALRALSAAWYELAADASSGIVERHGGGAEALPPPRPGVLSREGEVRLTAALHDIAAAFARCARACRDGRSTAAPIIARQMAATPATHQPAEDGLSSFESRERRTQRVA